MTTTTPSGRSLISIRQRDRGPATGPAGQPRSARRTARTRARRPRPRGHCRRGGSPTSGSATSAPSGGRSEPERRAGPGRRAGPVGPDVGARRLADTSRPAPECGSPCRATSGSSAFRTATPPSVDGGQRLDELAFRLRDRLPRAELAEMSGADVEHDPDPWRRDPGEVAGCARCRGRCVSSTRKRVACVRAQHRVRVAEFVVERAGRRDVGPSRSSSCATRSLVDVLPDEPVMPTTVALRQPAQHRGRQSGQRRQAVVHEHDAGAATGRVTTAATAPAADRRRSVVVPVGVLTGKARNSPPGVTRRESNSTRPVTTDRAGRPRRRASPSTIGRRSRPASARSCDLVAAP